ncbi:conserved unknown protein [Ectocarpus siliculosus]|uniref:Galactokinase n=1 Tax=Ectocarpus siliculosus TaxID=2880 RepID=D7FSK4_ECTSI|nr:conserved unknown protein [Ectocarpus siliculosus]|eukprot:CBJ31145.1 conserved unknown protein [Ectocarpus siliculosus]
MAAPSLTEELTNTATALFEASFGPSDGCAVVFAPGRVNLIGEHTDYNGGFVMPLALGKKTVVVGRGSMVPREKAGSAGCRIISSAAPEVVSFKADQDLQPGKVEWANYIKGVVAAFRKDVPEGYELSFDAAIASNVPLGGGLSSSAALEVSMATLLEEITGVRVGGVDKALRCQWSDHNFMGIPCGIMDQFVSALAVAGTTLLVDCRTNAFETVPLDDSGVVFVVTNTGIRHRNASGAYGERVQQCKDAVEAIKKRHPEVEQLRDASLAWVLEVKDEVDEKVFKRARHVVSEDRRTLCCAMALRRKDYGIVGGCMTESHTSLRDDYEVSIKELDLLVSIAMGTDGVYGSRMTGGGFGGCTVTLVKAEAAEALMTKLREEYLAETGNACECVVTSPCDGAGVLVPLRRPLFKNTALRIAASVALVACAVSAVVAASRGRGSCGVRAHGHVA